MAAVDIELICADFRMIVSPELGGSVTGFWKGETRILRMTPPETAHAAQTGAYVLVPYSNRIGLGQMTWQGRSYSLRNGYNANVHAMHGVGCVRPWQVVAQSAAALRLRYNHTPDDVWPFAFEAEQTFELHGDGLTLVLSARNTDAQVQPMGLGWHPFFARRADSALQLGVHTQWLSGPEELPCSTQKVNALQGAVAPMRLDNCFEGDGTAASMTDGQLHMTLEADSRYWVVYTPPERDFFCVEPVTHVSNAVQQPDPLALGLVALQPGASVQQQIRCKVQTV